MHSKQALYTEHIAMDRKGSFTIAHFSDPHVAVPAVRYRDILNKRLLGRLSWGLIRNKKHGQEVLDVLLRDIVSLKPDHTVVTGDLTHLGLPDEFRIAREMLNRLGKPFDVTVVPGNHDRYVSEPWEKTFGLWVDYMESDDLDNVPSDLSDLFPLLRVRGRIAIIGLSSAKITWPFLATGRIGKIQLEKLDHILRDTKKMGLFRVLSIHHPPLPGIVNSRRSLTDMAGLNRVLVRRGAELILHGHSHSYSINHMDTSQGKVPVLGVSSASAMHRRHERKARFLLCHITLQGSKFTVTIDTKIFSFERRRFVHEGSKVIEVMG